jgi:hypothetical protein
MVMMRHDNKAVLLYLIDISSVIGIHPLAVSSTVEHLELFQILVDGIFRIYTIVLTDVAEECHRLSFAAVLEGSTPVLSTFVCTISIRFNQLNAI